MFTKKVSKLTIPNKLTPASNKSFEHDGGVILYFNSDDQLINRMAFYNFQDIFYQLGHIPAYWELSERFK